MADIVTNLNEMHKRVNSKRPMPKIIPEIAKLQKAIPFDSKQKLGDKFVVAVRLALPGGFTNAAGDGTAGAFVLNEVRGGVQKKAEMSPAQLLLRDHMSYEDAAKAVKGERSFVNATDFFYEGLQLAGRKRIETLAFYGGVGIGKVSAYSASNAAYGNQPTLTIAASDWAPQIWAGIEGVDIDVMTGATNAVRGTPRLVTVDIENRVLVLSGVVAGTVANDILYFKGGYGVEMNGIKRILSNTGSLYGIDAAQYQLWKGTQHPVVGAFSFDVMKKGISKAVGRGLYGKLDLYLNPGAWDNLQTSIEALRVTSEKDVRKVEIGTEEIVYHSQNGKTIIHSHPMVKEGDGFGLFLPTWKRVGSQDLELGAPGFGGSPWFNLANNAGVEARMYTNQGMISETPAVNLLFTGIVNA